MTRLGNFLREDLGKLEKDFQIIEDSIIDFTNYRNENNKLKISIERINVFLSYWKQHSNQLEDKRFYEDKNGDLAKWKN